MPLLDPLVGGQGQEVLEVLGQGDLLEQVHGLAETEISWVGPVGFYAKAGARVSRVFRTAKLTLAGESPAR